jgi:hypothetical protein
MNTQELVERVYDHVEKGEVDKAVFACVRLSRSINDLIPLFIFLRELSASDDQYMADLVQETHTLNEEARQYLYKTAQDSWLKRRTLEVPDSNNRRDEGSEKTLTGGIADLQRDVELFTGAIKDMELPSGMGEFDTAAFTDRYVDRKLAYRGRMRLSNVVIERVRTLCWNYASRVEKQLAIQAGNVHFLTVVQDTVNNFFAARSSETYEKLMKASALVGTTGAEDSALLLTTVRRAIKAVADHFYPPSTDEVLCSDGKKRKMGDEQYLNRLEQFCRGLLTSSTSDELAKSELDYLLAFIRRLNDLSSKGVHTEVTPAEAKQGLIGLYMFLSNVIHRIEGKPLDNDANSTVPQ